MEQIGESLRLSATDLVGHLNCSQLTLLDRAVAAGALEKPRIWDPLFITLLERGARHEQEFVDHLRSKGFDVTMIDGVGVDPTAVCKTRNAMVRGDPIIVQGAFHSGAWVGRTDVLRRIADPSALGPWSYEVIDTKLARETRGGTILQLCLYADMVEIVQGTAPTFGYVVAPWSDYEAQVFRIGDFAAYYRQVRRSLETFIAASENGGSYPEPKDHCEICHWQERCSARRRADDHLCLVAGMSKLHTVELRQQGIATATELAHVPLPLPWKPERGAAPAYERLREQARIQVEGRAAGALLHELLPAVPGFGLCLLPEPSPGDVFFDLEGDPFAGEGGLEYLFGYAFVDVDGSLTYTADWAVSRVDEKLAFERFMDFVVERLRQYPDLHIYHFAPYEPAALKRLMGRYVTREDELDSFLRSHLFVDLHAVIRHAVRASVESYSLKKLEPLFGFSRAVALAEANRALASVQAYLELGYLDLIEPAQRALVAGYNRDDCLATAALRAWLEKLRTQEIANGATIARPAPQSGEASENLSAWQTRINDLIARLTAEVPVDVGERTGEQHARWLLAYLVDFHRRENKAAWWEHFRLATLSAEDLMDERAGIAGLEFLGAAGGTKKAPVHHYRFPAQETELRGGEDLCSRGGAKLGTVANISLDERWLDIKKRQDSAGIHPDSVYAHAVVGAQVLADSLVRLAEHVIANGMEGEGPHQAARDLLLREAPRIGGQPLRRSDESPLQAALRIAPLMAGGVLPIQGPPGTGKTHTGARMICTLVKAGKSVGITANSHKVIRNLLDAVLKAADEMGVDVRCIQKPAEREPDQPRLRFTTDNAAVLSAIGRTAHVAGGTAWLWARAEATDAVDVLFIDEAAQMSLANVLAVSQAARSIVLLGDPQQLDQPMQGRHPDGTDVSALHHILGEHQTIPADRGLFLEETWRLHPDICRFTSELFYEGRLQPRPGLETQKVITAGRLTGTGLRYVPVVHAGNQNSSPEEADCVRALVGEILGQSPRWTDRSGKGHDLTLDDILIITPYNAQLFELRNRLPAAKVGTVDKFQGQEAPVVIYSMATSSYADAPRGMEFLYSLNRLNVATSRAKCLCILVASPAVFDANCRTPRQMQLANAFCRYLELAGTIEWPPFSGSVAERSAADAA
jgi:uncharacterized protein